ncbi:MAG TPA: 4-hydroxyphenylacetate 3-hydroxylase N-terminal domain-containing protein [Ilumatobacter sp.]|nr:4-hydroxyphenylacetate 3-hydroxylase N-terminal domain-containing protein [Ilumatobacter sp.]
MALMTAADYTRSLQDGRTVLLDGRRVDDVTADPAYRNAVASIGRLYDLAADPANAEAMTFEATPGARANRIWQLPRSYAELVERRRALELWNTEHVGFMGRAPDHVASCISGMYMGIERFEAYDPARAKALADYYHYARDHDLYLSYVIINPQADRSKGAAGQADPFLTAGVVGETDEGLVIRGAKMLGTGAVLSHEVLVTCIQPLTPDDAAYAVSFVVPIDTPGLKLLSRRSYEAAAPSTFDYPLASRFDENDAVLFFDDVIVPWERVFVDRDVKMTLAQFHETPAHVYQNYQAQIRLAVKMKFLTGLAHRIAATNGLFPIPQVREALGQLAAEANMVESLVAAMEARGAQHGEYFVPDRHTLYSAQVLTQQLYGTFVGRIRDLAGGGVIMLPSSIHDYTSDEMRALIGKTQQSPVASSDERVKLFKLVWDAIGSEFGSRHQQYEMFYAGATFVTKSHSFRTYDWDAAGAMVDTVLASYDAPTVTASSTEGAGR